MRKITAGLFMALDGVVESPDKWHFPYFSDEMGAIVGAAMESSDAMLLGRQTYQEFAGFWPNQSAEDPFAKQMNETTKYVVSHTLNTLEWQNSTLVSGDVTKELAALKEQPGKDISIVGSPTLIRTLLPLGLVDELSLLVHPIVVGGGKRLFADGPTVNLELASATTIANGVQHLVYRPAR